MWRFVQCAQYYSVSLQKSNLKPETGFIQMHAEKEQYQQSDTLAYP